jgi:tetratricopeptide (TPR) repeat protein
MPDQLVQFKATAPAKVIMILTVSLALFASWFVIRWFVGNTMAEYFHPEDRRLETAQTAVSWAPKDPLPHWRLAKLIQTELPPDQISAAVAEYEKAVSLSPNDYRFWMDLGHALEQEGEADRAEKALREAVKLAPSYAYPRWLLGNLLLRADRYDEAFMELRKASEANEEFQPQLFNVAWQLNKDDFEALKASIGNTPGARAQFSKYLLAREKVDEGLGLWNSLTDTEKRANRSAAESIIKSLIEGKRFHKAVEVWNDVAPGLSYRAELEHIIDRGFEDNVAHGPAAVFGWQVPSISQVQVGIDANLGHTGTRSLRIVFQVRSRLDSVNITQLVPVQPDTQYDFECYVRTERLVSAATPFVVITDPTTKTDLITSAPAPDGNNNWQRVSLSFKTGAKSEAVQVRIDRNSCPDSPVCPIFGTVWYDDFDLKSRK